MATITNEALRLRLLAMVEGPLFTQYTTDSAPGDATSVIATGLIPAFPRDASIAANWFVKMTSGDNDGEVRRVSSYSSSTGDITVSTAFSNNVASGVTFEVHRYHPDLFDNAIAQAVRAVYPDLWLAIRNETIIVDNLLTNSDFENGTFTGWTQTQGTWTADTSRYIHGSQSATSTASGSDSQLTQNIYSSVNIDEWVGKTLHIQGFSFSSAASAARLRVTFDGGSTFTNGSYHGGGDEWEDPLTFQIDVTIPDDPTSMTVYCEVADGNSGNFDLVTASIDPVTQYSLPSAFDGNDGPHRVFQQVRLDEPDGEYAPLLWHHPPRPGHLLRLEGMSRLSVPSADSSTIEIDDTRAELLLAQAASFVYRALRVAEPGNRDIYEVEEARWSAEAARLRLRPGIRMLPMAAHERQAWRVSDQSGTRELLLTRARG